VAVAEAAVLPPWVRSPALLRRRTLALEASGGSSRMKLLLAFVLGWTLQTGAVQLPPSNGVAGCPTGNEQNPPTGSIRSTDFVDVEYTGLTGYRTRVRASGIVTWRGGLVTFPLTVGTGKDSPPESGGESARSAQGWFQSRNVSWWEPALASSLDSSPACLALPENFVENDPDASGEIERSHCR
jgi:hypothetical protein